VSFGIYVHWPFCAAKCPYCDFNSHVRSAIDETGWIAAIEKELDWTASAQGEARPLVETIFFGGGTPSLMSGKSIGRVLDKIARNWRMANDVEITMEANPASADAGRFADYRAAGVNRLSLGMQALNDADLKALGRLHDVAEAKAALKLALQNFPRVSLDLIYARPNQSEAAWCAELKEALSFGTEHLSLYQLTIEPETPYALLYRKGALKIPDEELAAGLYEVTQELTEDAGLPAYEISNHARAGAECRHNLIYWRYGDYAGVGPGAHGRLAMKDKRMATATIRLPERWQDQVMKEGRAFSDFFEVPDGDAAREHLMMALRLREGVDLAAYELRWGVTPPAAKIAALTGQGLLQWEGDVIRATPSGRIVLNAVISALLN
jgi:oxygen-independent coproporphyrinogen-3 oxidase